MRHHAGCDAYRRHADESRGFFPIRKIIVVIKLREEEQYNDNGTQVLRRRKSHSLSCLCRAYHACFRVAAGAGRLRTDSGRPRALDIWLAKLAKPSLAPTTWNRTHFSLKPSTCWLLAAGSNSCSWMGSRVR